MRLLFGTLKFAVVSLIVGFICVDASIKSQYNAEKSQNLSSYSSFHSHNSKALQRMSSAQRLEISTAIYKEPFRDHLSTRWKKYRQGAFLVTQQVGDVLTNTF